MKIHWPRGLFLAENWRIASKKGRRFDVADGAADLAKHEVNLVLADGDEVFDLVGHVGDDLDGFAQVIAPALLFPERSNRSARN